MADPSADQAIAEAIANTKQERLEATQPQVSRTARRAQALRPQDPLPTRPSTPPVPNPEPMQQEPTPLEQVQEAYKRGEANAEERLQNEQANQQAAQAAPPPEPLTLADGSTRPYLYFLEAQTSLFNQNWERATALATTGILSLMIGAATQIADKAAEAAAKLEAEAGKTESNGRPLS